MRTPYVNGVKTMEKFMVLCTFKQGTVMSDVFPLAAPVMQGGAA
ncbi:MAG: hypothetical protein WCJ32_15055 [Actinomycetota bacterium]